jgi:hypothetical protein
MMVRNLFVKVQIFRNADRLCFYFKTILLDKLNLMRNLSFVACFRRVSHKSTNMLKSTMLEIYIVYCRNSPAAYQMYQLVC